jgi:hypothetical protein
MKIHPLEDGLFIEAETYFESKWFNSIFLNAKDRTVVLKSGSSLSDVTGLKVTAVNRGIKNDRPRKSS